MTPETANLGRCECGEPEHEHDIVRSWMGAAHRCARDAVRMVTVQSEPAEYHDHHGTRPMNPISADVPMCEPCAAFHEAKERTR